MRAFIAVDISEDVLAGIEALVARVRDRLVGARWVATRNLHLTLRFLGESGEETLAAVAASVGSIGSRYQPFTLRFRGIGFFPSARRPRIFWVGVNEPPESLRDLQKAVETVVRRHGFEPEKRQFSPHLTLARFRHPRLDPGHEELVREYGTQDFGDSFVTDLVLYQSILKPKGAEYQVLKRFPLRK